MLCSHRRFCPDLRTVRKPHQAGKMLNITEHKNRNGDDMASNRSGRIHRGSKLTSFLRGCVPALFIVGAALSVGGVNLRSVAADGVSKSVAGAVHAPASAVVDPRWQMVPSPNGKGPQGVLLAVSCTAPNACTAVGHRANQQTLAERWNGNSWTIQPTPNPPRGGVLTDVSCASPKACVAVGYSYSKVASPDLALAERWDGKKWVIQKVSNPVDGTSAVLEAISCPSATFCIAVGHYVNKASGGDVTLSERWNGKTWAIMPPADPSKYKRLSGVSCTSDKACTAVGNSATGTLAERWNGKMWAVQPTPNPPDGGSASLSSVSCPTATACTAVGNYFSNDGNPGFAERWNGKSWTIEMMPHVLPGGITWSAVSCISTRSCTAVGDTGRSAQAVRWNGKTWAPQSLPHATAGVASPWQGSVLSGVSCTAPTTCTAVGEKYSPHLTLAERSIGNKWRVQPTPNPNVLQTSDSMSLSCASASACFAVFSGGSPDGGQTFIERWDGKRWIVQESTYRAYAHLHAVSCTSPRACTAVGYSLTKPGPIALVERWDGNRWSFQPVPGSDGYMLNLVSCATAKACLAVGLYTSGAANTDCEADSSCRPIAEMWDGKTWTAVAPPDVGVFAMSDLSCPSAHVCFAAAGSIERWDGKDWVAQPTPSVPGGGSVGMGHISCTSPDACTAIGSSYNSQTGVRQPLAERWNGTKWVIQPMPTPAGAKSMGLMSVSCTARPACVAVGYYSPDSGVTSGRTLAERWVGVSWSIQPTANPVGNRGSHLRAVSCVTETWCTAVGGTGRDPNYFDNRILAEKYS